MGELFPLDKTRENEQIVKSTYINFINSPREFHSLSTQYPGAVNIMEPPMCCYQIPKWYRLFLIVFGFAFPVEFQFLLLVTLLFGFREKPMKI